MQLHRSTSRGRLQGLGPEGERKALLPVAAHHQRGGHAERRAVQMIKTGDASQQKWTLLAREACPVASLGAGSERIASDKARKHGDHKRMQKGRCQNLS